MPNISHCISQVTLVVNGSQYRDIFLDYAYKGSIPYKPPGPSQVCCLLGHSYPTRTAAEMANLGSWQLGNMLIFNGKNLMDRFFFSFALIFTNY